MIGEAMGDTRNSNSSVRKAAELFEKPYSEWTDKQRKWFEKEYKRSRLPIPTLDGTLRDASSRGRKSVPVYEELYQEREIAKLSGSKVPTHREQSSKISDKADPEYVDKNTGISEGEYRRQRLIRASQRRQRIFSNPPKD